MGEDEKKREEKKKKEEEKKKEEKKEEEKKEIACVSSYGDFEETWSLTNQPTNNPNHSTTRSTHTATQRHAIRNGCCCHIHPSFLFVYNLIILLLYRGVSSNGYHE